MALEINDYPDHTANATFNNALTEREKGNNMETNAYQAIADCTNVVNDYIDNAIGTMETNDVQTTEESTKNDGPSSEEEDKDIFDKSIKNKNTEVTSKNEGFERKDTSIRVFSKIIDSDSEDEDVFTLKSGNKICNESENQESDSEENNKCNQNTNNMDSKSTCEERKDDKESRPMIPDKTTTTMKEGSKSGTKKILLRASKVEAMKQIQSETQRLIRESEISLPYHNPKQRTLQEFLNRRKIMTALPKAPTMAAKLKMSSAIVHEVLREKEKEAKIFYKSSDSEEEADEADEADEGNKADEENKADEANNDDAKDDCTNASKKVKVSRKLFVGHNLTTPESNIEKNRVGDTHEFLSGANEVSNNMTNVDSPTENNKSDSITVERYCDSDNAEIKNKYSNVLTEATDIVTAKNISASETIKKNSKTDLKILDELPDATPRTSYDYPKMVRRSLGMMNVEPDEYKGHSLVPSKFGDTQETDKRKVSLNLTNSKPKLRGAPGTVIDLSDDTKPCKPGISALIDRFMFKHAKVTGQINNISEVATTHVENTPNGLVLVKKTLPYQSTSIVNEAPMSVKPGTKILRLKEELKHKIAQKRDEEWKQKEQEIEWNEPANEKHNCDKPFSPSIDFYRTEMDELEEDNVRERKKKERKKENIFIDEEAEVSEDEVNEYSGSEDDEDEDEMDEDRTDVNSDEDVEEGEKFVLEDEDENSTNDSNDAHKSKTFKRIVEIADDDSVASNIENVRSPSQNKYMVNQKRCDENVQLSDTESDIPVSQIYVGNGSRQGYIQKSQKKHDTFDFVSPLTQLTVLNTDLQEEKETQAVERSLFNDSFLIGSTESQELSQELTNFKEQDNACNKPYAGQSNVVGNGHDGTDPEKFSESKLNPIFAKESNVSESQLLALCSGTFTSQVKDTETNCSSEIFPSTQISNETDSLSAKKDKGTVSWNNLRIVSSDEEDFAIDKSRKRSKKKFKKLDLSDDEEESNSAVSEDDEGSENEKYVDYDSEENEVVVPKKDIKKYAATFLEAEAELSESDCDVSADEDEKDMDKLEYEEVDDEEIDETQVKDQLGKLHMRQLLDADQKEVRMLQELLFEDGDLHSESARERKFKWKNIDKQEENKNPQSLEDKDGWVDLSDEEDEVKWRKIRHEREKFLAEKRENVDSDIENDLKDSQVFKFGLKILKKRRIDESQGQNTLTEPLESRTELRMPHTIAEMLNGSQHDEKSRAIHSVMQKRSFLTRGEESLARLAVLARQKEAPLPSNAKNFVFSCVDLPTEKENTQKLEVEATHSKTRKNR